MRFLLTLALALTPLLLLCSAEDQSAVKTATTAASKIIKDAEHMTTEYLDVQQMMDHIDDLRKEISSTIHRMGTELSPNIKLTRRDRLMFDHVLEALKQAEHASIHALDKTVQSVSPLLGPLTKAGAHDDLSSTALRYIGVFGLAMAVGNMIHYAMWGFFASGTLLMMFFSTVPLLFSSVMMFPSVLLFLEGLLGMAYLTALFSYWGISELLKQFDYIMRSTPLLEMIGMVTSITCEMNCTTIVIFYIYS